MGLAQYVETFWTHIHNKVFHLNFYRLHLTYFIFVILLSSVIVYGSAINGNSNEEEALFQLSYTDSLFLCVSAMTSTGLNTVNLSVITAFQQAVLFVLILMGNITTISIATVIIRRHYFKKYMRDFLNHCKAGRQMVEDIDQEVDNKKGLRNGETSSRQAYTTQHDSNGEAREQEMAPPSVSRDQSTRPRHHESGRGGFPYPWEIDTIRNIGSKLRYTRSSKQNKPHHYLSFEPSLDKKGRFHSLNEIEREELGGVEYRALHVLMWLLPAYILFWLALPIVILVPFSYRGSVVAVIDGSQPGNLKPGWWAAFTAISAYGNCGLDILNENMIPFQGFYLVLIVAGAAILAGNTFFPVFLRITIWAMSTVVPKHSKLHHSLAFLLQHPRRCFIMLFPSINTWYLAGIQASLHIALWIFWIILQIDLPTVWSIPPGARTISGLFQALGVRTGGFYVISMSNIAPALQVLYVGAMYISGLPIIISLRSTNTYEERSIGVEDRRGHGNGQGDDSEQSYISTHFKSQLASDAWWLFFALFFICIVERTALAMPAPGFSTFNVVFDVVSAFGTVGLSTGVPYDNYSFCGAWHTLSKVILMAVMIQGRHRGLPMAIDRAVLLPGQELMEKMDREYSGRGKGNGQRLNEEKERVREDESGGQAEDKEKGQDPEQDDSTRRMHQEGCDVDAAQTA